RTSPPGARNGEYGSTYWLDFLRSNPERRYVSDGDPERISFPGDHASELAPRFQARANAY
ncbi:MAG: xylanase, partial [Thermoleophilia bacterium]|nr:xylanase [Thermoleophilia bacterium]